MILQEQYDNNYFDGNHPGGYSEYARKMILDADSPFLGANAQYVAHKLLYTEHGGKFPQGAKVLDIGCAKGFLVEDFRQFGFDCWGVDWSEYAINKSNDIVKQFLILKSAYEYIKELPKLSYDVVILNRFMPCLSDDEIEPFLLELKRISKYRIYIIDDKEFYAYMQSSEPMQYYNIKPLDSWIQIIADDNGYVESIMNDKWRFLR